MRCESADFIGASSVSGCNKAGYRNAAHLAEMMAERGVFVDHSTVSRWAI